MNEQIINAIAKTNVTLAAYQWIRQLSSYANPNSSHYFDGVMSADEEKTLDGLYAVEDAMRQRLERQGHIFDKHGNYVNPRTQELDKGGVVRMREDYEAFEGTHKEWMVQFEPSKEDDSQHFGAPTLAKLRASKLFADEDED